MTSISQSSLLSLKSLTILYVEDDLDSQTIIADILKPISKAVFVASDGVEGLELYKKYNPDIVLTDIQMPHMNGIEMIKAIHKINPNAEIVIISAFNESEYLLEVITSGINYYLLKPINMSDLIKTFETVSKKIMLNKMFNESQHLLNEYKKLVDESSMVTKIDPKGIITYVNDLFCKHSGFSQSELIGKPYNVIGQYDTPAQTYKSMWQSIQKNEKWRAIIKNKNKQGSLFIVNTTTIPLLNIDGDIIEYISISNDVTKRELERETLEKEGRYKDYQEELAFEKQLNIIQSDLYDKYINKDKQDKKDRTFCVNTYYKALDTLCGDSYSIRTLSDKIYFYLLIDGMGKGVSASLTSMLLTSFINHIINRAIKKNKLISLTTIVNKSIRYIQPILLDEEVVSAHFICIDRNKHTIEYSTFSMPPILVLNNKGVLKRITSNNPPLSKYNNNFNTDVISKKSLKKIIFYSDGLVENSVKNSTDTYANYIEDDFLNANTHKDMLHSMESRIGPQEDDITFIFLRELLN